MSVCSHWFIWELRNLGGGREENLTVTMIWGSDNKGEADVRTNYEAPQKKSHSQRRRSLALPESAITSSGRRGNSGFQWIEWPLLEIIKAQTVCDSIYILRIKALCF